MCHRSTLAAGAALVAVGLSSATHAGVPTGPMLYTTVDSLSISFSGNGYATTTSYAFNGPSTNSFAGGNYPAANPWDASVFVSGFSYGGVDSLMTDLFVGDISALGGLLVQSGLVSWTVTFSVDVKVHDLGSSFTEPNVWAFGKSYVSIGDVFTAGTYTFDWLFFGSEQVTSLDLLTIGISFAQAGPGAVPLPGAAGLAAVGLVGLARRRRR